MLIYIKKFIKKNRQTAPCPPTPEPLTIREKAPTPPLFGEPTIIEVDLIENFFLSL